jgi:hypothetical protein
MNLTGVCEPSHPPKDVNLPFSFFDTLHMFTTGAAHICPWEMKIGRGENDVETDVEA